MPIHHVHPSQTNAFHHLYQMPANKFLILHFSAAVQCRYIQQCMGKFSKASTDDLQEFFSQLNDVADRKPGILSLVPPYSSKFVQSAQHLPPALQGMYSPCNNSLSYTELLSAQECCSYAVTTSQIEHLEELTRGQASNKQWFKYRAGRITASQIYQVWQYFF